METIGTLAYQTLLFLQVLTMNPIMEFIGDPAKSRFW